MAGKSWKFVVAAIALGAVSVGGIVPAAAAPEDDNNKRSSDGAQVTREESPYYSYKWVHQEVNNPSGNSIDQDYYTDDSWTLHQRNLIKDGEYQESHVRDATDYGSETYKTNRQYVKNRTEPERYTVKP